MKYLCSRCGWFIIHNTWEWQDMMGNESCFDGGKHKPTGKGVEVNEELRVRS